MPRAPTLPAMRAVTSAEVTRLAMAPKSRSGPLSGGLVQATADGAADRVAGRVPADEQGDGDGRR